MSKRKKKPPLFIYKTEPFAHQREAFEASYNAEAFALLMEQGTGKSKVALDSAAWQFENGTIDGILIIAPNGVHSNWNRNEIPKHLPDRIDREVLVYRNAQSSTKKFSQSFARFLEIKPPCLPVFCVNIEGIASKKLNGLVRRFLLAGNRFVIVDESSRIKTPSAQRTKAILKLRVHSTSRRILTGTPVTQGPFDLWSQFRFLDPGITGFEHYTAFRHYYSLVEKKASSPEGYEKLQKVEAAKRAEEKRNQLGDDSLDDAEREQIEQGRRIKLIPGRDYYENIISFRNVDELKADLAPYTFRTTKKECLDLPDKVYQRLPVELTKTQRALYKQMAEEMVIEFDDEIIAASIVLVRNLRLQQIIGGFLPSATPSEASEGVALPGKNPKLEALVEHLAEFQGKAIVWARFRAELGSIAERLRAEFGSNTVVEYHGGIKKGKARDDSEEAFEDMTSEVRFLVGNPRTGGIGLNLVAASLVVYYSNDYSLENRVQSEDRSHRYGMRNKVTYIDIEAEGTCDEDIVTALQAKIDLADYVNGDSLRLLIAGEMLDREKLKPKGSLTDATA